MSARRIRLFPQDLWIGATLACVTQPAPGQSLIRLVEDGRFVQYAIMNGAAVSDTAEPPFEDNYLGISAHAHDGDGRIVGSATQVTERSENLLRCISTTNIHGEGTPAQRGMQQESHWIFRFEALAPCVLRTSGGLQLVIVETNASIPRAGEARLTVRRGTGSSWETEYSLVSSWGTSTSQDAQRAIALVARPGELFELDVHTTLDLRVSNQSFQTWTEADVTFAFSPFVSTWTRWPVEQGGNGHWYCVVRAGVGIDWDDAQYLATRRGGHLCTISSTNENEFVFGLVDSAADWQLSNQFANGPWLGGLQADGSDEPAGGWQWVTGEPFAFTHWAAGEPSNSGGDERYLNFFCQAPSARASTWNDHDSAAFIPSDRVEFRPVAFVVEYEGLPCPDSDEDGDVDLADLALLLSHFGASGGAPFSDGDLDGDGDVEIDDLALLLASFGSSCN